MSEGVPSWCRVGYFIDAKDSMNDWCVAQVTDICRIKNTVTVFHDGWGTKTTTYPLRSSKIAPFRKNTIKYTGPKRVAMRDWDLSEEELTEMQNQIDSLLNSNLQCNDAFYITQFIRGKLYIFIENLLMYKYRQNIKFIKPAVRIFGSVVKLLVMWLKKAPELFPYYYKSQSQPDLYLEDSNTALSLVWPELMDTLNKLFALDNRVSDFFQTYDEVPSDYEPSPLTVMNDKKYSETLQYIINLFTKEKGFEAVIAILNEKDEQKRVPFPFIATTLLYVLVHFLDPDFWTKFSSDLTSAVYQRIDIITETELKDLKHEDILRVLSMVKDSNENLDKKKFNFFLRMIKSNYFEKRIKGLSEINTIIESIEKKSESMMKNRISRDELKDWILKNNLVELVVNDRPHVELIKRSSTIFRFLAQSRALEAENLEILWRSMDGKHESYIRATYASILEFTPFLTEELHDYLYMKFKSVPIEKYDEIFLSLVKDFTAVALIAAIRIALNSRKEYSKLYGLEIFEALMLDNAPVDFSMQSCKYIGAILSHALAGKMRSTYVKKLINLVVSGDSVPQALSLLMRLFKGFKDLRRQAIELKTLNEESQFTELILKDFKNLKEKAVSINPNELWVKIVCGRFTYEYNISIRLKFLEFLLCFSNGAVELSQENIEELWEMLGNSPIENERKLFYIWITKGIKRKPPLASENVEFIFQKILMDNQKFPVEAITKEAFACFKYIFLIYHANAENIEILFNKFKCRKAKTLEGFEKLLQIQLTSEINSEDAAKFIISLLLRYSPPAFPQATAIQEEFTDELLEIILRSKDNNQLVTRGLNLLKMLLGDAESENFVPNSYIYVHENTSREFNKIQYDQNRPLRHLRKEIASLYKKPVESVTLLVNEKRLTGVDDDMDLRLLKAHCIAVEFRYADYKEHNPLPGLSTNQKVIKSLFELLSNTEKSYTNVAWELLVALPTNQQLEEAFEALDEPVKMLLDQTSTYRLVYELMIIQKLSADYDWANKFITSKGLDQLIEIFLDVPTGNHAAMKQECLIKTISNFFTRNPKIDNLTKLTECFFTSLLLISNCIASSDSINRNDNLSQNHYELKDPDSFTKACEEFINFISLSDSNVLHNFIHNNTNLINSIFSQFLLNKSMLYLSYCLRHLLETIAQTDETLEDYFKILFELRKKAVEECNENYWKLLAFTVNNLKGFETEKKEIIDELISFIKGSKCEKNSGDKNEALSGALTVVSKAWTESIKVSKSHSNLFITKCLFEIPENLDRNMLVPPICKHSETRSCAFEVILKLCKLNPKFINRLVQELDKHHEEPDWRGLRRADWAISAVANEKSQAGYVGIKNLGCTCYMNSLLQQIFMITSFRNGILAAKAEPHDENMLYKLQYLFSSLLFSDKQYINPKMFTGTIKDFDGNPINVNEQMDVDEFFNYFMDKLEGYLKDSPYQNMIKMHFGGLQVTELIGKDCIHRSERYEPFLTVSVEVKNKKSLQESLDSFVAGEILEGENAYQCDHCEAKVRAIRRVCIKHLPNYLIIALRRFEFDFDSMVRVKLNDFCEFPLEINMEPYTQEGLERHEKEKEKAIGKDVNVPTKKFSDDYYNYKLRGIVIHAGTADSGHYYSYIQDSFKKWFEFNDVWVEEFNPDSISDKCFGGEEKFSWSSAYSNSPNTAIREKCGNAYLLFYERTGIYNVRNNDEESLEPASLAVELSGEIEHMKTVRKQNQKYWRNKHIFAAEYSKFIAELSHLENMPFKFVFKFTITVLLRTKEKREELIYIYLALENEIKKDSEKARWVLEMLSSENVCKELLLYCPLLLMRKIIVGLVKIAIANVDKEKVERVMLRLIKVLPFAKKNFTKNYAQYLEVLRVVISACEDALQEHKIIKILIRYLFGQDFTLPPYPEDQDLDIHLGYNTVSLTDPDKSDLFFTESKGCSFESIFHLLWIFNSKIPEKYLKILRDPERIESLLNLIDTKTAIRYFGKLYAHLMTTDNNLYNIYLKKLIDYSQMPDLFKRSQSQKLISHLLLYKCPLQKEFMNIYFSYKFKQLKTIKYLTEVESSISNFISLCSKSSEFQSYFKDQNELLSWIEKWLKDNMHYHFPSNKSTQYEESFRPNLKNLYQKCLKVMRNEDLYTSNNWDSDDDINEDLLQKGKYLDVTESNSTHWTKGFIKERIGDLLYMRIKSWDNSEYHTLKEAYSEDIAPCGHYTSKLYP